MQFHIGPFISRHKWQKVRSNFALLVKISTEFKAKTNAPGQATHSEISRITISTTYETQKRDGKHHMLCIMVKVTLQHVK